MLNFWQTAALDGETDLKTRLTPSACMGIDLELLHKIKVRILFSSTINRTCFYINVILSESFYILLPRQGVIECPNPDKDIRRFDANMRLFPPFIDNDVCPLTIKNTLLQSCYLRNTEWACGVAVYTGKFLLMWRMKNMPKLLRLYFLCIL